MKQTKLTTICLRKDQIKCLSEWKIEDAASGLYHLKSLTSIICFDEFGEEEQAHALQASLSVHQFSDIVEIGKRERGKADDLTKVKVAEPDDVFMLCYTPGTTGDPNGVKITHKMAINSACAFKDRFALGDPFT